MAEYSRIARGNFTSTGGAWIQNLPFQPDSVRFTNYTLANTNATSQNVISAYWDSRMGQGFAVTQGYNATPALIYDVVSTNGVSTFSAGQLLQYGPTLSVTGLTKAAAGVVTTSTNHGYSTGDVVILEGLYETSTTGMPQIIGMPFTITVLSATTFSINWNTNQSNYTAIDGGATGTPIVKKVLYPYLYFPGESVISALTLAGTTTVSTTSAHNFVIGQEVAFRIPSQWGTVQLNSLPNTLTPGSPVYGYVVSVTDALNFVVNLNSAAYSAFNSNPAVASVPGLTPAQVVAVGDVNTGGNLINSTSSLYPPPRYQPTGTTLVNTINGPAIRGAYVNNSAQGFVIGAGAGRLLTTSSLVGAANNIIYWEAFLYDYSAS